MARAGKKLESEIYTAFKHLGTWSHNSNDDNPACDRVACYRGMSILIECKETHDRYFRFARISEAERRHLQRHQESGGITLVAIERIEQNSSRLWLLPWEDFLELEREGRASFHLVDGKRPAVLREMQKVERPNSLGRCWDLEPFLYAMWLVSARKMMFSCIGCQGKGCPECEVSAA